MESAKHELELVNPFDICPTDQSSRVRGDVRVLLEILGMGIGLGLVHRDQNVLQEGLAIHHQKFSIAASNET